MTAINFDPMLRPKDWKPITGISLATTYRMVREGEFPKPVPIGKQAVGLRKSVLEAWVASREALVAETA